jgi:hypothetical protein
MRQIQYHEFTDEATLLVLLEQEEMELTNGLVWTREAKLIAGACWLATGVIGLIANFDVVPAQLLAQSWKLWPLIPLGIGAVAMLQARRVNG